MRLQLYFRFVGLVGIEVAIFIHQVCLFVKYFFSQGENIFQALLSPRKKRRIDNIHAFCYNDRGS